VPIVRKMGLLEKVKEKSTTEVGMQFVYMDGKRKATFEATGNEEQQSGRFERRLMGWDDGENGMKANKM
jgi:hypothetical protein